jgi:hypothetical protein
MAGKYLRESFKEVPDLLRVGWKTIQIDDTPQRLSVRLAHALKH